MTSSTQNHGVEANVPKKKVKFRSVLVIVLTALLVAYLWYGYEVGKGLVSAGEHQILLGMEAKREIARLTPLHPSDSATSCYYFTEGFQDHLDFAAYTDTPDHIFETVRTITGKDLDALESFPARTGPLNWPRGGPRAKEIFQPDDLYPECHTALFDLNYITEGRCFYSYSINEHSSNFLMLIVDTKKNRIYYMSSD